LFESPSKHFAEARFDNISGPCPSSYIQYNPALVIGQMLGHNMARQMNRLTAGAVATLRDTGRHADGGGLYLSISANGGRRWVFLYRWQGKPTELGLGSARDVPLSRARELAARNRQALAQGQNPRSLKIEAATVTFGECADQLLESMRPAWRNEKHAAQWAMTLREYAAPLRSLPVQDVDMAAVLRVLQPIWGTKPETASRLRGRLERVLDYARAHGHRSGENPARWRGHLDQVLPKRQRLTRGHHAALPYDEVPAFLARLRALQATAARALEFTILTAARSGETLGVRWDEIDVEKAVWTVPAQRMKAGREHRVPLSPAALELIARVRESRTSDYVFAGARAGRPLSGMAMEMVLRRMKVDVTTHGFRSAFRDWAAETTGFSNEVCEAALAHVIQNKAEAAYRRGDLFDKRRQLMVAWASYCAGCNEAGIVPLQ
jgi:integrase